MTKPTVAVLSALLITQLINSAQAAPLGAGAAALGEAADAEAGQESPLLVADEDGLVPDASIVEIAAKMGDGEESLIDLIENPEDIEEYMNARPTIFEQLEEGINRLLHRASHGGMHLIVDRAQRGTSKHAQTLRIVRPGQATITWKVSTGRNKREKAKSGKIYVTQTPRGTWGFTKRVKDYFSNTWKAPMPYAQFFTGGIALHATTPSHYAELGSRASGGCVRLTLENAAKLWTIVDQAGVSSTRVTVLDCADQDKGSALCQ